MTVAASFLDLDDRAKSLLDQLLELQSDTVTSDNLDEWLFRLSQLERQVQTLWITHILAVKRNANDANGKALYKHLVEVWIPQIESQINVLHELACTRGLAQSYPKLALRFEADRSGSQSEQQLMLQAQERSLITEYDTIASNKIVSFEGRNLTVEEALVSMTATRDRQMREILWNSVKTSELQVSSKLDALFLQLLELRQNLARVSESANYVEYIWNSSGRGYTPDEAIEFLNSTAEIFAELTSRLDHERCHALGVEQLRPWDLNGRLTTSTNTVLSHDDYLNMSQQILQDIDPDFGAVVDKLRQEGRFDLSPRLGKTNGGTSFLHMALNTTEIVCNLTGNFGDLSVLLHELGHAIHWHFLTPKNLAWDLYGEQEVEEFFAFVFQFLGCEMITQNNAFSQPDRDFYRRFLTENVLSRLRSVDERVRMELWLYSQIKDFAISKIDQHYLELYQREAVDWSSHQDYLAKQWQHQHLFTRSFYNIEYSIATVAALLFLDNYHKDSRLAIKKLKNAIAQGLTQGFKSVFEVVGIQFPFRHQDIVTAKNVLKFWVY